MQYIWHNRHKPYLIVYFAGWGTPVSAVEHLQLPEGYDLLMCYDYRELHLEFDFSVYQGIRLVAWSMGVWVAERILCGKPLLSATAVNGTGKPCDAEYGIPPAIFESTLNGLTEHSRQKFERRMCGKELSDYQQRPHQRTFSDIQAELTHLFHLIMQDKRSDLLTWTNAIIGLQDKIFPIQNQQTFWQNRCTFRLVEGEHFLFSRFSHWEQLWR